MKNKIVLCPKRFTLVDCECVKENCAWWLEDENECSIKTIAKNSNLSEALRTNFVDVRIQKDVY
jgi:hypothetical protein